MLIMNHTPGYLHIVLCILLLAGEGCTLLTPEESASSLTGSWQWERSAGGFTGWIWTADSLDYTPSIAFLPGNRYIFYQDDHALHTGNYRLKSLDKQTVLLTFDFQQEAFAWPSRKGWSLMLLRDTRARTLGDSLLLLIDPCIDCYTHRFRRIR